MPTDEFHAKANHQYVLKLGEHLFMFEPTRTGWVKFVGATRPGRKAVKPVLMAINPMPERKV